LDPEGVAPYRAARTSVFDPWQVPPIVGSKIHCRDCTEVAFPVTNLQDTPDIRVDTQLHLSCENLPLIEEFYGGTAPLECVMHRRYETVLWHALEEYHALLQPLTS
jgi:hypothetical protein